MRPIIRITSLAMAAALTLGACGGSSSTGTTATPSAAATSAPSASSSSDASAAAPSAPASEAPAASASAASAEPVAVTIRDFKFEPETVEVAAGQVVTWTNEDGEPHTVRSDDGSISSPIVGSTPFEWTAEGEPGTTIPYICSIHPSMKGSVTIAG